jgi:superfamily II DNA or RNA helicase
MPPRIRQYRLDQARDRVLRAARLRPPQRQGFDSVHELVSNLNDDLPRLSQAELVEHLKRMGLGIPMPPPQLVFALATGVGKTRLMGSLVAYLHNAEQTNNCLILAPRAAVVEKLERETRIGHPKYLFVDPALVSQPNLCFRDNIEAFRPAMDRLNVFVLSPQTITGRDRRFARGSEFRGFSLLEYLRGLSDLVVFVDESHHVGSALGDDPAAWMTALQDLRPRLYFGMTATPRSDEGVNVIARYDLATCLREGQYTKAVDLLVEQRDEAVSDEDWDRYTIDFAFRRLERKRAATLEAARAMPTFPAIEPVLLVCARDTSHAEELGAWLRESRGLTDDQLIITHSERERTEDDIRRLVGIDQPGSQVRVVVNVFQLTEGWDVTNVYVIAPLRAMATFRSAVQTMGRGLRLPMGRRTGNRDVDTLDVLCCGRESFEDILRQAIEQLGTADGQAGIAVTPMLELESETPIPTKQVTIRAIQAVEIPVPRVTARYDEPPLDFDIENLGALTRGGATALHLDTLERTGLDEGLRYALDDFVDSVHVRVLADLSYLSEPLHGEALDQLVRRFLVAMGATADRPITADPMRVALLVAEEIDRRYRQQPVRFEFSSVHVVIPLDHEWRVPEEFAEPMERVSVEQWR